MEVIDVSKVRVWREGVLRPEYCLCLPSTECVSAMMFIRMRPWRRTPMVKYLMIGVIYDDEIAYLKEIRGWPESFRNFKTGNHVYDREDRPSDLSDNVEHDPRGLPRRATVNHSQKFTARYVTDGRSPADKPADQGSDERRDS